MCRILLAWCCGLMVASSLLGAEMQEQIKVRVSWGHQSPERRPFYIRLVGGGTRLADIAGIGLEIGDALKDAAIESQAGDGDVDGMEFTLQYPQGQVRTIQNLNRIWGDLIGQSDADTARRLRSDPAYRMDGRRLTVQMDRESTRGFSVTVDQLLENRVFWIPSLDVYLTAGDEAIPFARHQEQLKQWGGRRVLDQAHGEDEATYQQYTQRWEDMGSPGYVHRDQPAPGHVICVSWDSALYKFGIDRGAGLWNDYGNPDRFRFGYDFGRLDGELTKAWKGQRLTEGLPVVRTVVEKEGVRYEVEQFAYPLEGPPNERRGDIPMVLLQKVKATNLEKKARTVRFTMSHQRQLPQSARMQIESEAPGTLLCSVVGSGPILFSLQGSGVRIEKTAGEEGGEKKMASLQTTVALELPESGERELIVKLASPMVPARDRAKLLAIDYEVARSATLKFWGDYLAKGAQFRVPEPAVNELFRANLWHALRLPRRHGGQAENIRIDLPYSNFAYDQNGIPWPINQAVYVDYMLYDLRGHHEIAAEELLAMYRLNQEANGHVRGYANWVVYTPGMVYASAKHYLLSGDRQGFEKLLPATLKAADWCLTEIKKARERSGAASGLVYGPLNDLTGDGVWAFSQAYIYASLDILGQALQAIGHPRAEEFARAAREFRGSIERGFGAATMHSPLVQLRDHTWMPYVPCEGLSSGRRMDQWYPTDVDTGAMHLPRLKAIAPDGELADYLLNDHEDNLYLKGWGMANEPVYNQQATVYLLRDDPKAAIRAFYSYMACAFSHSVWEPVEHRWTHGQYFGPPSTDGAWFELYRNMLIQEREGDSLLLLGATPRKWLEEGERIEVEGAPTYYGPLGMRIESHAAAGRIEAEIRMPERSRPKVLLIRLRHPQGKAIRAVMVNGKNWADFDVKKEWVRIAAPDQQKYSVVLDY